MTQPNNPLPSELRERLRNLKRTSPTDPRYPIHAYEDDLVALIQDEILKARLEEAKFFRDTLSDREIRELSRQPTLATWQMHIGDLEAQLNQPNTSKEME